MNTNNTITRNQGVAVSTIDRYNFFISGVRNFENFDEVIDFMKNNNNSVHVEGHKGIRISLNRHDGFYVLRMFNLINNGVVSHDYRIGIGQRMAKSAIEKIVENIYWFVCLIEAYEKEVSEVGEAENHEEKVGEVESAFVWTNDNLPF